MARFIIMTFAFLGWAFYEMSGGGEFEPTHARLTNIKTDPLKPAVSQIAEADKLDGLEAQVTRVSLNLTSVDDVLAGKSRTIKIKQQQVTKPEDTLAEIAPAQGDSVAIISSLIAGADPVDAVIEVASLVTTNDASVDIRTVKGNRVNVRGGPGTDYGVVNRLVLGDEVEILEDLGNGWVRLRPINGGTEGWMADFLLTNG